MVSDTDDGDRNNDKRSESKEGVVGSNDGMGKGDSSSKKNEVIETDDEDENSVYEIEEEQLEEYREIIDQLGNFPDKVTINSLSMVAEDHAESKRSALALYNCIRAPLLSSSVASGRKLPLVYVIDSILKNVKGAFIPIIQDDAKVWMPLVFDVLSEDQRIKLKKVWTIWREVGIFSETSWKEMGSCFEQEDARVSSEKKAAEATTIRGGIVRAQDGTLKLPPSLRKQMQILLDEMHTGVSELDKVSLERLADINPDLLVNIKKAAEEVISSGQTSGSTNGGGSQIPLSSSVFVETRTEQDIARSTDWEKLNLNYLEQTHDLVGKLQHFVMTDSASNETYSQSDAIRVTSLLAAAAATATHLTNSLQRLKDQDENKENVAGPAGHHYKHGKNVPARRFLGVDKNKFTNEGVKEKNDTVIGSLYEVGLPFVSSSDGRRFATQIELSNHLDYLFKKRQIENSMERTEERGWYVSRAVWTGQGESAEAGDGAGVASDAGTTDAATVEADPATFTVPADESRDRCVICGINFKMFFDNDDGIYRYSNCREIEVLNDDAAEKESEEMLVHVSCWRGLGSPELLTMDQALQERKS